MSLRSLFIDFNSYFASAEQQLRPELRARPVAVTPVLADSGCCIAASIEAKKFGVKTGVRVREAREMCPGIEIVAARPSEYVRMHHRLIAAIDSCAPVKGVYSIDEMSIRLANGEREPDQARALALRIKKAIREQVGVIMRCSIGIAPNRFLAKVGTDMMKPDGLVIIQKHELPHRLHELDLIDLPGIGPRMKKRLEAKGIHTVEQLCAQTESQMANLWESIVGRRWYLWLRGEDTPELTTHKRSLGHQHVLPPKLRTDEQARAVAIRLLHKAAARMRQTGYFAQQLTVAVTMEAPPGSPAREERWGYGSSGWGSGWHATAILQGGSQDTLLCIETLTRLWRTRPPGTPKLVSVTFSDLIPEKEVTMPLFEGERQRTQLSKTMDTINARYGKNVLHTGAIHDVLDTAAGGIAFNFVPDLEVTDSVE